MVIENCPFLAIPRGDPPRPWLPTKIVNPHTNRSLKTYGLIDTGADECSIPAGCAEMLGHDLRGVQPNLTMTAGGPGECYPHTTIIEIYNLNNELVYTVRENLIDYMPNLHIVLLGVRDFLTQFILHIDYPNSEFSIQHPSNSF